MNQIQAQTLPIKYSASDQPGPDLMGGIGLTWQSLSIITMADKYWAIGSFGHTLGRLSFTRANQAELVLYSVFCWWMWL